MDPNQPVDLHRATAAAYDAGDPDLLASLYETDAVLVNPDGSTARGTAEIRAVWAGLLAFGGTMAVTTRHVVEQDGIALLRNDFTITAASGDVIAGSTAEVARRQPDGRWLYLIDHPFGAA